MNIVESLNFYTVPELKKSFLNEKIKFCNSIIETSSVPQRSTETSVSIMSLLDGWEKDIDKEYSSCSPSNKQRQQQQQQDDLRQMNEVLLKLIYLARNRELVRIWSVFDTQKKAENTINSMVDMFSKIFVNSSTTSSAFGHHQNQ